jgi:hypothetical protein
MFRSGHTHLAAAHWLGSAAATHFRSVAAATAATMFLGGRRAPTVSMAAATSVGAGCGRSSDCQRGNSRGQNEPGHDENSLRFTVSTKMWETAFLRPSSLHPRRAAL